MPLEASQPLLPCLASLLEAEQRPSVFCSLCLCAARLAASEPSAEALQGLRRLALALRQRDFAASGSEVSSGESSGASEQSAPTVATAADLETGVHHALQHLCLALGL